MVILNALKKNDVVIHNLTQDLKIKNTKAFLDFSVRQAIEFLKKIGSTTPNRVIERLNRRLKYSNAC